MPWRYFTYFIRLRWVVRLLKIVCTVSLFSIPMCLLVNQHLSLLARKFPETKFVKAIVNSCIQHYHDNCLPTIFVYKNGQIEAKFIGILECGGINLKLEGNVTNFVYKNDRWKHPETSKYPKSLLPLYQGFFLAFSLFLYASRLIFL